MKFAIGEIVIIWHPRPCSPGIDLSYLHGTDCEIIGQASAENADLYIGCDYRIDIDGLTFYAMECELRKRPKDDNDESHYDGNVVSSWDDEDTVWQPEREIEYDEWFN